MKKRILALALALVMVFSLFPVTAFAVTEVTYIDENGKEHKATSPFDLYMTVGNYNGVYYLTGTRTINGGTLNGNTTFIVAGDANYTFSSSITGNYNLYIYNVKGSGKGTIKINGLSGSDGGVGSTETYSGRAGGTGGKGTAGAVALSANNLNISNVNLICTGGTGGNGGTGGLGCQASNMGAGQNGNGGTGGEGGAGANAINLSGGLTVYAGTLTATGGNGGSGGAGGAGRSSKYYEKRSSAGGAGGTGGTSGIGIQVSSTVNILQGGTLNATGGAGGAGGVGGDGGDHTASSNAGNGGNGGNGSKGGAAISLNSSSAVNVNIKENSVLKATGGAGGGAGNGGAGGDSNKKVDYTGRSGDGGKGGDSSNAIVTGSNSGNINVITGEATIQSGAAGTGGTHGSPGIYVSERTYNKKGDDGDNGTRGCAIGGLVNNFNSLPGHKGGDSSSSNSWNSSSISTYKYIDAWKWHCTLSFNPNGGSGGTETAEVDYGTAMPAITVPTKTGYTFAGYYDNATTGTQYYKADGTGAKNWDKNVKTATLFAHWTPNPYTIHFDLNGGTGEFADISATYDAESTLPADAPTYTYRTFTGWNTEEDGSGDTYAAGAAVKNLTAKNGDTVTLYAQYKHDGHWTYSAVDNVLKATCEADCPEGFDKNPLILTLTENGLDTNELKVWRKTGADAPTVTYYDKDNKPIDGEPYITGSYTMKASVGDATAEKVIVFKGHDHAVGGKNVSFKPIGTLAELKDLFTNGGSGYLTKNITADAVLTVTNGKPVNLCLNDKTLNLGKNDIEVATGASFNLFDENSSGVITGGSAANGGAVNVNGTFAMNGGSITGNTASTAGGGICVGSTGTLLVGGTAVVSGNSVGEAASDVKNSGTITIGDGSNGCDAPKEGMSVGLHYDNGMTCVTGATSGQEQYFFSDDPNYKPAYNSGTITLVQRGPWYINEAGEVTELTAAQQSNMIRLSSQTTWDKDWVYVTGNVTINSRVTLKKDVNLILADGANLTVNSDIYSSAPSGRYTLNVYTQTKGNGKLTVDCYVSDGYLVAGVFGNLTIYGGIINISGRTDRANMPCGVDGSVTVNSGIVTLTGSGNNGAYGVADDSVTVNDGDVTITASTTNKGAYGVYGPYGGNSNVTVNGGNVKIIANGVTQGWGVYNGNPRSIITVNGGSLDVTGTSSNGGNDAGYAACSATVNVTGEGVATLHGSTSAVGYATVNAKVQTSSDGKKWTDWDEQTALDKNADYKYLRLTSDHEHAFEYTAANGVLTATCKAAECYGNYDTAPLTLTLTKPDDADLAYDGDAKEVSFVNTDTLDETAAWNEVFESVPSVVYYLEGGETLTYAGTDDAGKAPKDPGTYVATVTAGGETAKLTFSIYNTLIGTTNYYPSLAAALDKAADNDTVKLLADITADSNLEVTKSITLDLNKQTLKLGGNTLTLNNATGVTVTNGTVAGATDKIIVNGKAEIKDDVTFAGTIQLNNAAVLDLPGTIELKANQADTKLKYDKTDGKIKLLEGQLGFGNTTKTTVYVDVTGADDMKVEITPAANSTVSVKKDTNGASVCGAGTNDKVVIGGVTYTAGTGDIPVVVPHKPFPSASVVTIPAGQAATININNDTAKNGPTVATDDKNNGSVTIVRGTESVLPASVTIAAIDDSVRIDPDGSGESAAITYKTTADNTVFSVASNGNVTLTAGGVELDQSEKILINNGEKTVEVETPTGKATATVTATADAGVYTVSIPKTGAITIGNATYTNEGDGAATLQVTVDAEGNAVVEITLGTVGVPDGQKVKVDGGKIENATGGKIVINASGDVVVDNNKFTYTAASDGDSTGVKFTMDGSTVVATMNDVGAKLAVKAVASGDADVRVVNGTVETNAPFVLVDNSSAGKVEVENGSDKLDATVTGDNSNPTKVKMGGTQYTVPAGSSATFTTTASDALPTLTSGSVELDSTEVGSGEEIYVDGVKVSNTTGAALTITDNAESEGDDGKFDLKSGNDTFTYTGVSDDNDLTVTKNASTGALQFVLNNENETVEFKGTKTQNTEFSDGNNVFVTVDKDSQGNVKVVSKGENGFDAVIDNGDNETSKVTAGATTYEIPANTKTTLSIATFDGVAKMTETASAVTVPNDGSVSVDGVEVKNSTGTDLTIKDNDSTTDGKFDLTSGTDTFTYTGVSGDDDLTVTKNAAGDALRFVLNTANETVEFKGPNTQTVEFSNNGTDVFVTVDKDSTGDAKVSKTDGGFEATIDNGEVEGITSTVTVGGTTYTVPEKTKSVLSVSTFDGIAVMTEGTVTMPTNGKVIVNGVTVENTTGKNMTVTKNEDGSLTITVDGAKPIVYTPLKDSTPTLVFRASEEDGTINLEQQTVGEKLNIPVGQGINIFNGNSETATTPVVAVTAGGGSEVTVEHTSDGFTATVANNGNSSTEVKVGGTTYTVPTSTETKLSVGSDNGIAEMTGTSGAVTMTGSTGAAAYVKVDGVTVENTTGEKITVKDNENEGEFDLTIGDDTFTYTKGTNDTDLTVTKNGDTNALRFVLNTANETVEFAGTNTQTVEFSNNGTDVFVTVDGDSAGKATVEKTASGFETEIDNSEVTDGTSIVTAGNTTYTIPENVTAVLDAAAKDQPATLKSGTVELDGTGTGEAVVADGVTVTNTTGEKITVTEDGTADGEFDLTSGTDTFTYTANGNTDLEVKKNNGNLQFVLDTTGETVEFSGTTQTVEFSNNGTDVFVTVAAGSTGDATVSKTSSGFETEIVNESSEASTVKVGGTEYTIPASTTTKLRAKEVYGVDGTAFMLDDEGAVIFGNGTVYVDNVFVKNSSGEALKVTDNEETAGDDGKLTLNSGNNEYTYYYTKDAYDKDQAAADTTKYKFTLDKDNDALKFVLYTGARVEFNDPSGTINDTTTKFADESNVFVTVDGSSKGKVSVEKVENGFETEIVNGKDQQSVVKAGITTYTVPAETTTKLSVSTYNGVATMSQGTVTMPTTGKVNVLGGEPVNVINGSGKDLTTKLNEGGTLTATVKDAQPIVYTRPENTGSTLVFRASDNDGTILLEQKAVGEKLSVPAGQGIKLYDGNSEAATTPTVSVTKDGGSKVDVEHTDTTAFTATVESNNNNVTNMQMGATKFSVPVQTTSKISVASVTATPALLGSDGAVTFGVGTFYVDSVYVDNNSAETFTVKDDAEKDEDGNSTGDNGDFTVTSSKNEKYIYHTAKNYDKDAAVGTFDLEISDGTNSGDLRFTMDDTGEWLKIPGVNGTTVEFDNASGTVCTTVKGSSTGDVTVTKGSFEVQVKESTGTSVVVVGNTEYTVPAGKGALLIGDDDPAKTPELISGTVELDTTENVGISTGEGNPSYNVQNTGSGIVDVTNGTDCATFVIPANGKITIEGRYELSVTAQTTVKAYLVNTGEGDISINALYDIKLVFESGAVSLTENQTIHTNSTGESGEDKSAQIINPNTGTIDVEIDAEAGSVTKDDTVITLTEGQTIYVDETVYTAQEGGAKVAVDNESGKPKLILGGIEMGQGNSIKIDDWTVEVPSGKPAITVDMDSDPITPTEINLAPGGEMIITAADGSEFVYVNNSKSAVKPQINADGKLTLTLSDNASPENLPAGSYESINIRTTGVKQTTYTFEDDLDTVLSVDNVEPNDVIVINTTRNPSTASYVLTQNGYTIYGVGGDIASVLGKTDTTFYSETEGYLTVDSRERADFYGVHDMANALADCMVVKVVNGEVFVQAGEARIVWSDTDTAYYPTLADALYDAAHYFEEGGNTYNTHTGKGRSQTIIMNINPYADRENIVLESDDKLITCGEDPTKEGDVYTAQGDTAISMFENSNDVYVINGTLIGNAGKNDTDKTVTVYMGPKDSGFYMSGEKNVTAHCCPDVMNIINKALLEMKLAPTEGAKQIIKSVALDDIAVHIPLHSAYDATVGTPGTHGLLGFFASIFNARLFSDQSVFSLLSGILSLVTPLITVIRDFFNNIK